MDWRSVLAKVAPTLSTALGGPLAGVATKFIADNLLNKPEALPADVEAAVTSATPEQLVRLKELDSQFRQAMRGLDLESEKIEASDRVNARDLFKVSIWPQIVLSSVFVIGYFSVLYVLFLGHSVEVLDKSPWAQGVLTTVLGVLTAAVPQILSFWFGSSMGSKEKTRELLK